ncbi:MAG: amidoligase family protein [Clostridia bacterium]
MCYKAREKKDPQKGENTMKEQTFGVEIEFTGITRATAARAIATTLGTSESYIGGAYKAYEIADTDSDRKWKIVRDGSIRCEDKNGETTYEDTSCELVTPICNYCDIERLQEIVRTIRKAGGRANQSCGLHCHIGANLHTARSLKNLANIMASKEDLLFKALAVEPSRATRWCKKVDESFIEKINKTKLTDKNDVKRLWYNGHDGSYNHYDDSRYHALNLHAVWQKGTVEFRGFNSTLHAGKVKAYIQLCLAISWQAITQERASHRKTVTTNDKYTFRTWLLRLGLIGDEFKTARLHLLENLEGDTAWKDNRRNVA